MLTYAAVLLLGHAYGFTLTLPGIAGFIVAVGITADSFIVYFERLRDEVREGRTLRTAVETGWVRPGPRSWPPTLCRSSRRSSSTSSRSAS